MVALRQAGFTGQLIEKDLDEDLEMPEKERMKSLGSEETEELKRIRFNKDLQLRKLKALIKLNQTYRYQISAQLILLNRFFTAFFACFSLFAPTQTIFPDAKIKATMLGFKSLIL